LERFQSRRTGISAMLNAVTVVCVTQKLVCVLVSRVTKGTRVLCWLKQLHVPYGKIVTVTQLPCPLKSWNPL